MKKTGVHWFYVTLVVIYSLICAALVFKSNPYLYSTKVLQNVLAGEKSTGPVPIPDPSEQSDMDWTGISAAAYERMSPERSALADDGTTYHRNFFENHTKKVETPEFAKGWTETEWITDNETFVFSGDFPGIFATTGEGQLLWWFQLDTNSDRAFRPVLDKTRVYLTTHSGRMVVLNKSTGELVWMLENPKGFAAAPILLDDFIYVASSGVIIKKDQEIPGFSVSQYSRSTGEYIRRSQPFRGEAPLRWSYSPKYKLILFSGRDSLSALELVELKVFWHLTLTDRVQSWPVIHNNDLYLATENGQLISLNLKNGHRNWEINTETTLVAGPTFIPEYKDLALLTESGRLQIHQAKDGERRWKFDIDSEAPMKQVWGTRLMGQMIEELEMKWHYKGWVVWLLCAKQKICLYNPHKGQLASRIKLEGQMVNTPHFTKDGFYSVLKNNKAFYISHYLDKPAFTRLQKEKEAEKKKAEEAQTSEDNETTARHTTTQGSR